MLHKSSIIQLSRLGRVSVSVSASASASASASVSVITLTQMITVHYHNIQTVLHWKQLFVCFFSHPLAGVSIV